MIAHHVDGIGWPKPDAVGEKFYVSEVKAEITEVHWRLNLQLGAIDK